MMTDDVYSALCSDDVDTLRQLMSVGTSFYNKQLWEGTKIWPRITRRMTAVQLAVREGTETMFLTSFDEFLFSFNSELGVINAYFIHVLGSGKVLQMLIEDAKLDVNYGQASTALTTAIEYKRLDMMVILIAKGVQVIAGEVLSAF